ncbi:hypothetical protein HNQ80_004475 [Anaerosolibacter carboniphilus]|uniref:Small, acid-soluble spore protein, alpha/beta type n=1 Tax=Anaerosolibacter carboniphilus TaxID=1417629 RepID=A0A841KXX7_9FIRM|nr:alpha/beta-type small acid-soluble spore protein [Anaerosolibacter carboniphilus]MBB6218311.1 hypothetical protein [Anaerosolibacter carboniphilus]
MRRGPVDPNATKALLQMREEIAKEMGVSEQLHHPNGSLTASVENIYLGGRVGGNMTRRLIEIAEKQLTN